MFQLMVVRGSRVMIQWETQPNPSVKNRSKSVSIHQRLTFSCKHDLAFVSSIAFIANFVANFQIIEVRQRQSKSLSNQLNRFLKSCPTVLSVGLNQQLSNKRSSTFLGLTKNSSICRLWQSRELKTHRYRMCNVPTTLQSSL